MSGSAAASAGVVPEKIEWTSSDRQRTNRLGLMIALGGVTMLFAAFTSAYIVRSSGDDWVPLALPPVVFLSTALIVASSASLEAGRRAFAAGRLPAFRIFVAVTALLGAGFLASQLSAYAALNDAGIFLRSHPKSSFFFVLTGVHGAHLLAGVLALAVLLVLAFRGRIVPGRSDAPALTAIYWHFVGGLWLYLLGLLSVFG